MAVSEMSRCWQCKRDPRGPAPAVMADERSRKLSSLNASSLPVCVCMASAH